MTPRPAPARRPRRGPPSSRAAPRTCWPMVPVVLGFDPAESVVMLTFGAAGALPRAGRPPGTRRGRRRRWSTLLARARRAARGRPTLPCVVYADDERAGRRRRCTRWSRRLAGRGRASASTRCGSTGDRWFRASPAVRRATACRYDVASHPFLVRGRACDGEVAHQSREELRGDARRPTAVAVAAVDGSRWIAGPRLEPAQRPAEVAWALATVSSALGDPEALTDPGGGAGCWPACATSSVRDAVWVLITRDDGARPRGAVDRRRAPRARRLRRARRRRCWASPPGWPGTVRWPGARSTGASPRRPGATAGRLVAELLARAVPPSAWDECAGGACVHDPA